MGIPTPAAYARMLDAALDGGYETGLVTPGG